MHSLSTCSVSLTNPNPTLPRSSGVQAARLGVRTRLIGKVGPDDFGRDYLKHLEQDEGVDVKYVGVAEDVSTGIAQITG